MSRPTCCCSVSLDRCDRCDLLVDLEGFHLMGVARTPDALVLDVESCNQLVGCPGFSPPKLAEQCDCGDCSVGRGWLYCETRAGTDGVPARVFSCAHRCCALSDDCVTKQLLTRAFIPLPRAPVKERVVQLRAAFGHKRWRTDTLSPALEQSHENSVERN